jgi:spore coat polysaccharide biosynthesis protein SpsF
MKVVAVVQARTGSTRLPKKIFLPLVDKPLIWHIFDRITHSKTVNECLLATSTNPLDDALTNWARSEGIQIFRGSEEDVLSRIYYAAVFSNADIIVRVTADDPFKDPVLIDEVVARLQQDKLAFASNNNPPSYPEGLDVEVFTFESLKKAYCESRDPFEREHVTQYFYRNPELFKQVNLPYFDNLSHLRWTLDTTADYQMAQKVYYHLYKPGEIFLFKEILQLIHQHPDIALLNKDIKRSAMYR